MSIIYQKNNLIIGQLYQTDFSLELLRKEIQDVVYKQFNSLLGHQTSGAPFLVDNSRNIHISISHTSSYYAIYSTEGEKCGVDIELNSRDAARVSRKFTNDIEVQIVKLVYPKNPELLIWCAKEAIYKMCEREGAEFKTDFSIISARVDELSAAAFTENVKCYFFEIDNLLITTALCR